MKRRTGIAAGVTATVALFVSVLVGLPAQADETAQDVIVVVPDGSIGELLNEMHDVGEGPDKVFTAVIDGASASLTPDQQAELKQAMPEATIVPDTEVSISDVQTYPQWHLDRIDQTDLPLDTRYSYPTDAGKNAIVYVIDTGVQNVPTEFGSRLTTGADFTGAATVIGAGQSDPNGHGTHVAGLIGSKTYGVAKNVTIVPLKALKADGTGATSAVIAAVNYAVQNTPAGTPAVINMSLGGPKNPRYDLLNATVSSAVQGGISVVVAAGNGTGVTHTPENACGVSPASAAGTITVGATDPADNEGYFSNYGGCVDVLAPGVDVYSVRNTGGNVKMSGTSMATPVVAGVAALYRSLHPAATPGEVSTALLQSAAPDKIQLNVSSALGGTPNKLVSVSGLFGVTGNGLTPAPVSVTSSNVTTNSVDLSWAQPTPSNGSLVSDYEIQYRAYSETNWTTINDGVSLNTSVSVTGLASGTLYSFRVASVSLYGSNYSAEIQAQTASGVGGATAPQSVLSIAHPTSVDLTWSSPTSTNGKTITNYRVDYRPVTSPLSDWQTASRTTSTAANQLVSGLATATQYEFRVMALSGANLVGNYSTSVTPTTQTGVALAPSSVTANSPLPTVSKIALSWIQPVTNGGTLQGYVVRYRAVGEANWRPTVSTSARTLTVTGLSAGTTFEFQVAAQTQFGTSPYSTSVTARTLTGITSKPQSLTLLAGRNNIKASWQAPLTTNGGTIARYIVEYKLSTASTWNVFSSNISSSTRVATIANLQSGLLYNVRVTPVTEVALGLPASANSKTTVSIMANR